MKKLAFALLTVISIQTISAQKYTDTYIKEASKIGSNWLNNINNKQYDNAYNLLSKEVKIMYQKETWTNLINELMLEFGKLKNRSITDKYFQSEVEGIEDGFYVFLEFNTQYENTSNHTEYVLLKQNDKAKWEVFDYNYEFKAKEE